MPTNPDPKFVALRQGPHRLASRNRSMVRAFSRASKKQACSRGHVWKLHRTMRKGEKVVSIPPIKVCQRCGQVKHISNFQAAMDGLLKR